MTVCMYVRLSIPSVARGVRPVSRASLSQRSHSDLSHRPSSGLHPLVLYPTLPAYKWNSVRTTHSIQCMVSQMPPGSQYALVFIHLAAWAILLNI